MFSAKTAISLMFVFCSFLLSCTKKEETKIPEPTPLKTNEAAKGFDAGAEEFAKLNELPVAKEWAAIWQSQDQMKALKDFQSKNGLFLETNEKIGTASVQTGEGPCGDEYLSLVTDARKLSDVVLEIDDKGKILNEWHPGTNEILSVNKKGVYREVVFYENLASFSAFAPNRNMKTHKFILAMTPEGTIDLIPGDTKMMKWETEKVDCPAGLKYESAYKYCVKDKKSQRLFMLQGPCT